MCDALDRRQLALLRQLDTATRDKQDALQVRCWFEVAERRCVDDDASPFATPAPTRLAKRYSSYALSYWAQTCANVSVQHVCVTVLYAGSYPCMVLVAAVQARLCWQTRNPTWPSGAAPQLKTCMLQLMRLAQF